RKRMSLPDYVDRLESVLHKNDHTAHQYTYLAPSMDIVAPIEAIDAVWARLQEGRPWLAGLDRLNASRLPDGFSAPDEVVGKIRDLYRRDSELYDLAASEWL